MSEKPKPKPTHGVRTPGPDPVRKPIPAGSMSSGAAYRNALEAAGDPNPDEIIPEAVVEMVDIKFAETGRDPARPGKL